MNGADVPGAGASSEAVSPVARARALLDHAEAALAYSDLAAAEAMLGEMAEILASAEDRSSLIGQALWMAAMVSLVRGQIDEFTRVSASAIEGFALAGDEQTASALTLARAELVRRVDHEYAVRKHGARGLIDVLTQQAETLLARARGAASWDLIDRDRAHLAALVHMTRQESLDGPEHSLPLARLMRALELNALESTLVATLAPLCSMPGLAEQAHALAQEPPDAPGFSADFLAEFLFEEKSAHESVLMALAPRAPLMRYRVVRQRQPGGPSSQRIDLEPAILWFIRDTPLGSGPLPPGVTVYQPGDFLVDIAPPLRPVVETLMRAFVAPRSSLLVLAGRPGTGKLTATLAAAAHARRPLITVDADALTEEQLATAMADAVRDAFLHGAVLLIRWQWQRGLGELPRAVRAAMDEPGLRLCLATTSSRGHMALATARRARADVLLLDMPSVSESEQHLAWRESLLELGLRALDETADDEIQTRLCRPGLSIGDIVETVVEAIAHSDAHGQPVTLSDLSERLNERLLRELETWTEVLGTGARPSPAMLPEAIAQGVAEYVDGMAAAILGGQWEVDELGLHSVESARPGRIAGCLAGGSPRVRELVAHTLARRVEGPLARIDMHELIRAPIDTALAHLRDTVAAAGRAGAILLIEHADALIGEPVSPLAGGLGRLIDDRSANLLLGVNRATDLPLAVESHIDDQWIVDLDGAK